MSKTTILVVILVCLLSFYNVACENTEKPVYHYKVYRENLDASHTLWIMPAEPTRDEGFLCWPKEDGSKFCISGKITVDTYQVGVK